MHVLHVVAMKSSASSPTPVAHPALVAQCRALASYDLFTYETGGIWAYLKARRLLAHRIRKGQYDIVHAHFSRSGLIAILASRRVPIVVSFMGSDILGRSISNKIIKVLVELYSKHMIVRSSEMASRLFTKNKFSVIPTGVDLDEFEEIDREAARSELELSQRKQYVLFAANPNRKEKNYSLAKQAFGLLRQSRGDFELLTLFNLTHNRMCVYLNACDALLLTSLYEGSPCIIKEAMACNCPIVATDVGDVREVIGRTVGCYVTSFDPQDVAAKLRMALSLGRRTSGREAIRHMGRYVIARRLAQAYEKVLVSSE